jgi:hypothetical protein
MKDNAIMKDNAKNNMPIVPVCSICNKLKINDIYIQDEETYKIFQQHFILSHGFCPECLNIELNKLNNS